MNNSLLEDFRDQEILKAVKEMGSTKAPGYDGFLAIFYQRFWHIIGKDGRLISNNVLVAYELMHTLKRKRTGKEGSFALKLDMSKAYDQV
ncbi:hypothetical protein J1N35_019574 [Gossypium stocksii]|uniref:Reverse transcriptase domain-containing protein n=1 Tax=Gossypium stocksii TaxID=47602 RepID=A0A9D4A613_9ROSI|nr:hypothetical protein J1N35_019574 [Gossypium stocksii]